MIFAWFGTRCEVPAEVDRIVVYRSESELGTEYTNVGFFRGEERVPWVEVCGWVQAKSV